MTEELFGLIFLFIIIGTPFCGAQECQFYSAEKSYVCEKIVYQFPNAYYGSYKLRCHDCQIQNFDNDTFPFESNLESFNVSNSGVQQIGSGSFRQFKNLKFLFLSDNLVKNISRGAFEGLDLLYELHLERNQLESLVEGFLAGVSTNVVNLSRNSLTILPARVFSDVTSLLTLDLSRNHLRTLNKDSLDAIQDLEHLDLSHNQLCSLPLGMFKSLTSLGHLNLAGNKFSRLGRGVFTGLKRLITLNLAGNSLNNFNPAALLPMMELTTLDVSGNAIYTFDANEFLVNVPTLREIFFEDNLFSCPLLESTLRYFKSKSVKVQNNFPRFEVLNVNGIACIEDYTIAQSISLGYFLQKSKQQAELLNMSC